MGLRGMIKRNFWAKFLSLVLACWVWLGIRTGQDHNSEEETKGKIPVAEKSTRALPKLLTSNVPDEPANAVVPSKPFLRPVAILKPPGDAYAYEVKPAEIEIIVQGEIEQLKEMDTTEIRVFVDITDVLEKFGSAQQHSGIPVLVKVHTPTTVKLASVVPNLASVKRIPPPEPVVRPERPKAAVIKPDESPQTHSVNAIKPSTNSAPPSASAGGEAPPKSAGSPIQDQTTTNTTNRSTEPDSATPRDAGKNNE
ncbi:MAG: hypothetical protein ACI8QF_003705 [Limisphaerales bacterium]|jgi:hypothetical protein